MRLPAKPGWVQARLPDGSWGARYSPQDHPADAWEREWFDSMTYVSPEKLSDSLVGDWIELTTRGGTVMWVDVREVVYCDAETVLVRYTPPPRGDIY